MLPDLKSANVYVMDNEYGALSAKHMRVAEIIRDYNPELELAFIPRNARTAFDADPFAVIHNQPNGQRYVVMTCKEEEVDERLLAKVFMADHRNGNVLKRLEAEEAARQAMNMKQQMDEWEDKQDFVKTVIKGKHYFRHNGKVYQ